MDQRVIAGRYYLQDKLGEGGTGAVYRAHDTNLDRIVAIKLFSAFFDKEAGQRFIREMQTAATLQHPAIVPVYDFGQYNDQSFYVMRYMAGGNLTSLLERGGGPLSPQTASDFLDRLASALDAIHSTGLVHRNIKPSTIMLDERGEPYLGGFAIVHTALTSTAALIGTPGYMAPEQITGEKLDSRTDIYLLGLILFEMLTGERPFPGDDPAQIWMNQTRERLPSLRNANPNLSADYDRVIAHALAADPRDRYATAGEMAQEFAGLVRMAGTVTLVEPVRNPFVVGNPVAGELFVGRAEIFTRLRELWGSDAARNVNSVVLFGHRRMGKTSILQNLDQNLGQETIVAGATMQRVGRVTGTGELLSYLAFAIYDALSSSGYARIEEPEPADYYANGYQAFNLFLRDIREVVAPAGNRAVVKEKQGFFGRLFGSSKQAGDRRVILTIDEFELIEEAIADGRVDAEFLDYLRGIIHSEPWLILALAGLHTLEEMTADYWNPLFASVTPLRVSFFSRTATGNLLGNPRDDFPLTFTNAAADRIYALVQGQPYLTQLIAYTLVSDYNEAILEGSQVRTPEFTPKDVDRVVESRMFYDQGSYYFNGVWVQAEKSGPDGQIPVMRVLARSKDPLDVEKLAARTKLSRYDLQDSLKTLRQHDVVKQLEDGRYDFTVPIMRRWIEDVKFAA